MGRASTILPILSSMDIYRRNDDLVTCTLPRLIIVDFWYVPSFLLISHPHSAFCETLIPLSLRQISLNVRSYNVNQSKKNIMFGSDNEYYVYLISDELT